MPTNFRQTPGEVAFLGQASGASAMICHSDFAEHVTAAREAAPGIGFVVSIGPSEFGEDYDALVEQHRGQAVPVASVEHDDPCWYFFTSGTTGRPKAAVLTHGQMAFVITNHLCDLMPGTTHRDASLVLAPLSHGAGIHQLVQVARGVKSVLLPARPVRRRRGLAAGRALADHEHVHGSHHREDADRAPVGRRPRSFVACAT